MGLLANGKDKTLDYNESRRFQKLYKKISALQITKILKQFYSFSNSEENRLKYGIEQEFHLMTVFNSSKKCMSFNAKTMMVESKIKEVNEFSVSLQVDKFLENIPQEYKEQLDFMPEYAAWMVEIVPKTPFKFFLNSDEIKNHLNLIDSLNKLNISFKQQDDLKKRRHYLLSVTAIPKLGYADYYIRPNGDRIPYAERKENNKFSNSKYYIDETVSKHIRFPTLTKNTALKRGSNVEINIPIFIDKNTKIICKNLYEEPESYKDISYKIEEKIIKTKKIKEVNYFL